MRVARLSHRLQDRVLATLGRQPADRAAVVRGMLLPKHGEAAGYWLQLGIATMLATLGLALNSTAVVIGAMLIAPLMKPLVDLAMGLATGSAALALRAAIRTVASIALVVLVATAITWLLPFHDITNELEARTIPSLLDLAVAAACALAAAYATLRADADIATTAAGTSIGISLVPPLCACGYGIALGDPAVSRGAALLFTANLSGILAIATMVFVLAGFAQVDIRHEEETFDEIDVKARAVRVGRAWSRFTTTRLGPLARVVPPLFLLAIVFLPLQRAVGEIKHRGAIREAIGELLGADKRRVVQYTLNHTASTVFLRVVVVGDARAAGTLEKEIRLKLAALDVENPGLSVWAVPDAASLSALARRVDEIPPPVTPEPMAQTVHRYSSEVGTAIRKAWPSSGTGELVAIWLDLDRPDHLRMIHLGPPIGSAGVQLLARVVETAEGHLDLGEDALLPIEADPPEGIRWLVDAVGLIERTRRAPGMRLCITFPDYAGRKLRDPERSTAAALRAALESVIAGAPDVSVQGGKRWRIVPAHGSCSTEGTTPAAPSRP